MIGTVGMNEIAQVQLGPNALRYLWSQLEQGGPFVTKIGQLPAGRIWGYLPVSAIGKQEIDDFESGAAFTPESAHEILQRVHNFIAEFLDVDRSNVVIAEDQFFQLTDTPNADQDQVFRYEGKSYHYRYGADREPSRISAEQIMRQASHYPWILVLAKTSSDVPLPRLERIENGLVKSLIERIQHVIVGAFDEEGFLIWSKEPDISLQ
jgi:hypothetical protein